jgi:hypothetical protein
MILSAQVSHSWHTAFCSCKVTSHNFKNIVVNFLSARQQSDRLPDFRNEQDGHVHLQYTQNAIIFVYHYLDHIVFSAYRPWINKPYRGTVA